MKKTISIILAAVLMFAMCLPAFAEGEYVDAVPGEEYAKLTPNQQFLADAFFKAFNEITSQVEPDEEGNRASVLPKFLMPYFAEHIADELDFGACPDISGLKETLDDDVKAALKAVLLDADYMLERGSTVQGNAIKTGVLPNSGPTIAAIRAALESYNPLVSKMTNLIVKYLRDNPEKDVKTDANRKALADYVYRNFVDRDQLYEVYKEEGSIDSVVEAALIDVWDSELLGDRSQLGGDYDENGVPTQEKIQARFEKEFKSRAGKDAVSDFIGGIFPGFSLDDFEDMFKGIGDSLLRVGNAVSGLFGSLLGDLFGGNKPEPPDEVPTTTEPPAASQQDDDNSKPADEDFSNTKTGDTALYAVLGLVAAASLALVLSKKKKGK